MTCHAHMSVAMRQRVSVPHGACVALNKKNLLRKVPLLSEN